MSEPVVFEPVDGLIMRDYQLTPILASHYPSDVAFGQKVNALIHRTQTQARDIVDLDHLLRCGVSTKGMISQIPASVYAVSLARTRRYVTPLGVISIHHIAPEFFFGYETLDEKGIRIARPEKALLDVFHRSIDINAVQICILAQRVCTALADVPTKVLCSNLYDMTSKLF